MDGVRWLVHIVAMTPELATLLIATWTFVLGHFLLSSLPVRGALIPKIGVGGHRALYSAAALGTLAWVVVAYGDARMANAYLWDAPGWAAMIPVAVMPFTGILFVCSVTSRNPTAVGGERLLSDPSPVGGIMTITRHPMMVGFALWAAAHIPANGDGASLILFGGMLVLSVGGMLHIDHRRARLGGDWGPIALTTSIIPFAAALQGRTKVDWAGIGLWRPAAGLILYVALIYGHPWFAGVAIIPH